MRARTTKTARVSSLKRDLGEGTEEAASAPPNAKPKPKVFPSGPGCKRSPCPQGFQMEWMCPSGRTQPSPAQPSPVTFLHWVWTGSGGPRPEASDVRHPVILTLRGYQPLYSAGSSRAPRPLIPVMVGAVGGTLCASRAGKVNRVRPDSLSPRARRRAGTGHRVLDLPVSRVPWEHTVPAK